MILNHWREKAKTLAGNVFSPPYLPTKFILFYLLTSITHFAIMLMNYSPTYWHSSLKAKGIAPGNEVFETSPIDWLIFSVVYLSIALFCLTTFNYRWSLIGWFTAEVIHFIGIGSWLEDCNFGRWSISAGAFCESFDARILWVIAAIPVGFLFATNLYPGGYPMPREKLRHGGSDGISRAAMHFSAAWSFLLLIGVIASAGQPTSGWVPLELDENPPPLQHAAHTYDTNRNRLVMFGGANDVDNQLVYINETWEWDGKKWLNVSPPPEDSPSGRTSTSIAYDEERGVTVLYGGHNKSGTQCDTWEWDGKKWSWLCPPDCPGARFGHEMYYDPIRKQVVLYGGYDNKTHFNDAWGWDGDNWTRIEMKDSSPVASHFALAYDPDKDYAFGLLSGFPGGTWIFKDDQWTHLSTGTEPSNRSGTRLAYEPERKVFITFGGYTTNTILNNSGLSGGYTDNAVLNDTWFFDGKNWSQFTDTKFQPPIRSHMVVWYDEVRKRIMLFGGHNDNGVFNDTWELILPQE